MPDQMLADTSFGSDEYGRPIIVPACVECPAGQRPIVRSTTIGCSRLIILHFPPGLFCMSAATEVPRAICGWLESPACRRRALTHCKTDERWSVLAVVAPQQNISRPGRWLPFHSNDFCRTCPCTACRTEWPRSPRPLDGPEARRPEARPMRPAPKPPPKVGKTENRE